MCWRCAQAEQDDLEWAKREHDDMVSDRPGAFFPAGKSLPYRGEDNFTLKCPDCGALYGDLDATYDGTCFRCPSNRDVIPDDRPTKEEFEEAQRIKHDLEQQFLKDAYNYKKNRR